MKNDCVNSLKFWDKFLYKIDRVSNPFFTSETSLERQSTRF
ncbi:hypothetical protein LEP1GSC062_0001 [Leptospira alexanderi serovar Manhao 3 str. L 60]|uniref:Uncharacterized protein n=1 Tax=Leptospira alexanderi serovar Manhao 3 str. L 60 TaxID=1049759 RepID=V6I739_9LEPT|nr:hypothetical protein LEP1GSC062_0001 [Leptospira alexanderi serovar Manhao 3 str. L 60]